MKHGVLQVFAAMVAAVVFSATSAAAQALADCDDWRSHVLAIAEPWEANTKTYEGGALRLVIMDVGEPVVGSYRLMVLTPPTDENPDGRQCTVMSLDADLGFAGLSFDGVTDFTDPTGLTVRIPAKRWIAATDTYDDAVLSVTFNATDGAIAASFEN